MAHVSKSLYSLVFFGEYKHNGLILGWILPYLLLMIRPFKIFY